MYTLAVQNNNMRGLGAVISTEVAVKKLDEVGSEAEYKKFRTTAAGIYYPDEVSLMLAVCPRKDLIPAWFSEAHYYATFPSVVTAIKNGYKGCAYYHYLAFGKLNNYKPSNQALQAATQAQKQVEQQAAVAQQQIQTAAVQLQQKEADLNTREQQITQALTNKQGISTTVLIGGGAVVAAAVIFIYVKTSRDKKKQAA